MTNGVTTTAITAVGPYIGTNTVLTLTATPAATATHYNWVLPLGAHQLSGDHTNVITVDFAGVASGTTALPISVFSVNGCDLVSTVAKTLSLTRALPPTPGVITPSTTNVCSVAGTTGTVTYSIADVAGAFANGYVWAVPTGASITSGQGSTSITVSFLSSFTAGNVSVTAANGVGTSLVRVYMVAKLAPAAPLTLSGQLAGLCAGPAYSYSFAAGVNATSYLITGPSGSVITSASNSTNTTNSIITSDLAFTVVYPSSAIANISIVASNGCSTAAAKLFVVTKAMSAPTAITGPTAVNSCTSYTYTTPLVTGATTYTWTVPAGAQIDGGQGTNSLQVTFATTTTGAMLKVKVSNTCSLSSLDKSSAALTITTCSGGKSVVETAITAKAPFGAKAYPNPFAESFKLDLSTTSDQPVEVKVYDMMGKLVEVRQVNLSELSTQEVGDRYPTGVYNVIVSQGENVKTLRMIKR
jgi:hypothetical protein